MVQVRIEKIKVNRGGPLQSDFLLEPGDVNLIYGHNETGKTYIVETIIGILFRTGRKSAVEWDLREWPYAGNVIVSGIGNNPVTFTKTGKKLEDYWVEEIGLPQEFSNLLVVRAGEALLAHEVDGVGRDILKNCLSGEGLLDDIEVRISATLQKTEIQNRQIFGPNQGEIRKRDQIISELVRLDDLLVSVERSYTSGESYRICREREIIEGDLKLQEQAKRYHASCQQKKRKDRQLEQEKLPTQEELSQIESDVSIYENNKLTVGHKEERLKELERNVRQYQWTEKAIGTYKEIMDGHTIPIPKPLYLGFTVILIIGALVSGVLDANPPLFICTVGALGLLGFYYYRIRRALMTLGSSRELDKLKSEFNRRFGSELTDRAVIEAELDKLREDNISSKEIKRELEADLIPDLKIRENNIQGTLRKFTGAEIPHEQWISTTQTLKSKFKNLSEEINKLDLELASLAISDENTVDEDPGVKWNSERYLSLNGQFTELSELLTQELHKLEQLKTRINQETQIESTDWEELITVLQDKRDKKVQEYKEITAEIIAKVQVDKAVQEFRQEENVRIATGLENEDLVKPLYSITGCYKAIRHEIDTGLVLTNNDDEEFPLSEISTGAREQVFLALRMGFSSILLKGQPAFLILDDAFQYSAVLNSLLAKSRWHVRKACFYHTFRCFVQRVTCWLLV